jgi:hypothetical protein
VPTLNGRKDPAPHPGVDLATLRFARPTPTKSPSTDSRLAGFPESSPQQIAPDTPATSGVLAASLLRAPGPWNHVIGSASVVGRVSAVQNVGTVSAKKILKAHDSLLRESASASRALASRDSLQGRAHTSSPRRDPRATHPRAGSDPRAPPRQARRSLLEDQQAPRHRLASVDRRTSTGRPQGDHMKTASCCAPDASPAGPLAPRQLPR